MTDCLCVPGGEPANRTCLPLDGVRVLDLTAIFAGPSTTMLLADWGAEVIRLENFAHYPEHTRGPRAPEPGWVAQMEAMRHPLYTWVDNAPGDRPWNRYAAFNAHARNKLSATLDVTTSEGRAMFLDLVSVSDVVVENNAPSFLERYGIDYGDLAEVNPNIIVTRMPAFGLDGPYRSYKANGANVDAIAGHTWLRGYPDADPSQQGTTVVSDAVSGISGALATVLALINAKETGTGQLVEVPMLESFLCCFPVGALEASLNGDDPKRLGNKSAYIAPQGCYACAGDDQWVTIAVRSDAQWRELCRVMQFEDWLDDGRFTDFTGRWEFHSEIDARITRWTSSRTSREVTHILQEHSIPALPVLDEPSVFEDPQLSSRGAYGELYQRDCGTHLYQRPWWLIDGQRPDFRLPPAMMGEATDYVKSLALGQEPGTLARTVARPGMT